jgi:hypothetical protein
MVPKKNGLQGMRPSSLAEIIWFISLARGAFSFVLHVMLSVGFEFFFINQLFDGSQGIGHIDDTPSDKAGEIIGGAAFSFIFAGLNAAGECCG